jgi:hypothetical protein
MQNRKIREKEYFFSNKDCMNSCDISLNAICKNKMTKKVISDSNKEK